MGIRTQKLMRATVLIPTFERNDLLRWNLDGLARQDLSDIEVFVLDDRFETDTECSELVDEFRDKFDIHYIHTGQTKDANYWRIPGFAINIGAKRAKGDQIVICCAEMYHQNETVQLVVEPLEENPKRLTIPHGRREARGSIRKWLTDSGRRMTDDEFDKLQKSLKVRYPFFMGINRDIFMKIGGYDEDFTGIAADDDDLIGRLNKYGCGHHKTEARVIHLEHSLVRANDGLDETLEERKRFNKSLWAQRRGQIYRNRDREWGVL